MVVAAASRRGDCKAKRTKLTDGVGISSVVSLVSRSRIAGGFPHAGMARRRGTRVTRSLVRGRRSDDHGATRVGSPSVEPRPRPRSQGRITLRAPPPTMQAGGELIRGRRAVRDYDRDAGTSYGRGRPEQARRPPLLLSSAPSGARDAAGRALHSRPASKTGRPSKTAATVASTARHPRPLQLEAHARPP